MATLLLQVVSQEKQLLKERVESVSVVTTEGEITILPGHIPLFSKLTTGELRYTLNKQEYSIVISKGFVTVAPDNQVTVLADSAVDAREISMQKAEAAVKEAQSTILSTEDQRARIMAEASLRRALLELKIAERSKRNRS